MTDDSNYAMHSTITISVFMGESKIWKGKFCSYQLRNKHCFLIVTCGIHMLLLGIFSVEHVTIHLFPGLVILILLKAMPPRGDPGKLVRLCQ